MDAIRIYEGYFSKKKKVIDDIIQYYKNCNKTIGLWGAGKKGIAFLKVFDSNCDTIDYVYDKDIGKYGNILQTGHVIENYKEKLSDVIIVANSIYEIEIIHTLKREGINSKVINVDNIVLGELQVDDVIRNEKIDLKKIREVNICAVVILYNPDMTVVDNIKSYATELESVYLYDNSERVDEQIVNELRNIPNIQYIKKNGNMGLPVAYNEMADVAIQQGYEWMITFDQDSIAEKGMIQSMRRYVNSAMCDENVAIVAPVANDIDEIKDTQERYVTYFDKVIQSGAMHNLSIMQRVGNYDEGLFIDWVDYEYCARCIVSGYKIVKLNNALLMHNQQDEKVERIFSKGTKLFLSKYSSDRYYYIYRNVLYCLNKYKEIYPLFALECENKLNTIKLNLEADENYEENCKAIEQAKHDYQKGIMGIRI